MQVKFLFTPDLQHVMSRFSEVQAGLFRRLLENELWQGDEEASSEMFFTLETGPRSLNPGTALLVRIEGANFAGPEYTHRDAERTRVAIESFIRTFFCAKLPAEMNLTFRVEINGADGTQEESPEPIEVQVTSV